jgi:hypothetical protein
VTDPDHRDDDPEPHAGEDPREEREGGERDRGFRRLGDSLIGSLFGSQLSIRTKYIVPSPQKSSSEIAPSALPPPPSSSSPPLAAPVQAVSNARSHARVRMV